MSRSNFKLDDFDNLVPQERLATIKKLAENEQFPASGTNVNMHFHTFYSYNAHGYSPARIALEARRTGLYAGAICDFDVLDGMDEFYRAGLLLGLRTSVHLETRVFCKAMSEAIINSPGEPGVSYVMGAGFAGRLSFESEQSAILMSYRQRAEKRNQELVARINERLPAEVAVDFKRDVLPLTPSGNATERHIIRAYIGRARAFGRAGDSDREIAFWSDLLELESSNVKHLIRDEVSFEEAVRVRMVKQGGLGYRQPDSTTFPPLEEFINWVLSCGAIPMAAWLDGTTEGEAHPGTLLDLLTDMGVAAVNIIPERNWNYVDPEIRLKKRGKLKEFVETANRMNLPINIGTELNKNGLPFTDRLDSGFLKSYRNSFMRGARIIVGHSILLGYAEYSYSGSKADSDFKRDLRRKNQFFESVGALPPLDLGSAEVLSAHGPERAYALIRDSAASGRWRL